MFPAYQPLFHLDSLPPFARELAELKRRGLRFTDCVQAFGSKDHPAVAWAKAEFEPASRIDFDSCPVVCPDAEGAWVSAWVWVEKPESQA